MVLRRMARESLAAAGVEVMLGHGRARHPRGRRRTSSWSARAPHAVPLRAGGPLRLQLHLQRTEPVRRRLSRHADAPQARDHRTGAGGSATRAGRARRHGHGRAVLLDDAVPGARAAHALARALHAAPAMAGRAGRRSRTAGCATTTRSRASTAWSATAARYLPAVREATYVESLFEVKTVLVKNEGDDGRPILFERHPRASGLLLDPGRQDRQHLRRAGAARRRRWRMRP